MLVSEENKECVRVLLGICVIGIYIGFLILCASTFWKFLMPVTFWQRVVAFGAEVLVIGTLAFVCVLPLLWILDNHTSPFSFDG